MIPLKTAWTAAVIAMALELTVAIGIPAVVPGHSLLHDYISTAGATDSPAPVAFAALGIMAATIHLIFVAAIGLSGHGRLHAWSVGLFAGFFLLLAVSLGFQCDPGCAVETTEAIIHTVLGILAFASLGIAALIHAVALWLEGQQRSRMFAAAVAVVAADLLLLLGYSLEWFAGLIERLTIVAMMVWSVTWMVRLTGPVSPSNRAKAVN